MNQAMKDEIMDLVKISLRDYTNKDNLKLRAIVIGKLLEKHTLFNFKAKLDNLKYTYSQKGNNYTILTKIFDNLYNNYVIEDLTYEIFIIELNRWFQEIKAKDLVPYVLVFPINLNFRDVMPFQILTQSNEIKIRLVSNHEFRVKYYSEIFRYRTTVYDNLINKKEIEIIDIVKSPSYSYFILEIYGRNLYYAVKNGSIAVGINSGIFCFIKYAFRRFIRIGGDPFKQNISKIDTPIVFVFTKTNSHLHLDKILFSTFDTPNRAKEIRKDNVELFLSVSESITKIQNRKLRIMALDAFKTYYNAIRLKNHSFTFLKLWNIFEALLLNNPELKEGTFIKRMKAMYSEDLETLRSQKLMVDILYNKRNMLVHESIDTIDEYDRDFLRTDLEFMMEYFLIITQDMKNIGALSFFYDNINKPIHVLEDEMKVLNYIKQQKSNNSVS